jgi:hypothetical protein
MAKKEFKWKVWLRANLLFINAIIKYFAEVSSGPTRHNSDIARRIVQTRSEYNYETILSIINLRDDVVREFLVERCERVQTKNFWYSQSVPGVWESLTAKFDPKIHTPSINVHPTEDFRNTLKKVDVEVIGEKDSSALISTVTNGKNGKIDNTGIRNEYLILEGDKLKIFPDDDNSLGVYFVNAAGQRFRSTERLLDNTPMKVTPRVPADIEPGEYGLEIVTRYSGGQYVLKEPRTIVYKSKLTIS